MPQTPEEIAYDIAESKKHAPTPDQLLELEIYQYLLTTGHVCVLGDKYLLVPPSDEEFRRQNPGILIF